jgi:hypothetical protein
VAVSFDDCVTFNVVRVQEADDVGKCTKDQDHNEHEVNDVFQCLADENHEVRSTLENSKPVEKSYPKCEYIEGT